MTGMPFNLQGKKGVFQLAEISSFSSLVVDKWINKKELEQEEEEEEEEEEESDYNNYNNCFVNEPTSVLDTRKSRSPPTSTSTLSSSLGGSSGGGGGGTTGSTDTAGVAAVSDNPPSSHTKWQQQQQPPDTTSPDPAGTTTATTSPTELHPIPTTLDIISGGGGGAEKCVGGGGGGMEDWESMWPETAASPSQEQSLLRWIMGDVEDPSSGLKHFLQGVGPSAADQFELNNNAGSGFGFVDSGGSVGGVLEALSCSGAGGSALLNPSFTGGDSPAAASSSLRVPTTNLPNNGRFVVSNSIPNPVSSSSLPNHAKIAPFSSTSASAAVSTNPSNPPIFSPSSNNLPLNLPLPISLYQQQHQQQQQFELAEEKPQLLNPNPSVPQILINHQQNQPTQNPAFFVPLSSPSYPLHQDQHLLPPQPKRHHPAAIVDPSFEISKQPPFSDSAHQELYLRRNQNNQQFHQQTQQGFPQQLQLLPNHLQIRPMMAPTSAAVAATRAKIIGPGRGGGEDPLAQNQQHLRHQHQQQHALLDQLLKAAELVETGNLVHARGILARLNHQLSPIGKPLLRAAFYFKEALLLLTNNNAATTTILPPQRISTPFDVFLKIGSYKAFSEISPNVQFANFTCNQVLLEALEGFNSIRIIDFDLGLGGQWASFMQEISLRMGGAPSLKITAITSPSSHDHPLELVLAKDNLSHFASDLGISFVIEILNLDSYDPASWSLALNVSEGDAVAVNLPASPSANHPPSFPSLLRLVKQLSPKIVVSVERGCDRSDLPFLQHFLHSLNSYSVLLESLDAVSTNADTVNKIERFLLQPRIDSTVIRRHCLPDKVPPCRTLFTSAAFSPFPFSNFTETQAEWLVKRLRVRGFHVEKRQNSLVLCWHMPQQDVVSDLVSVSAWTC